MERITEKDLQNLVNRINEKTNSPTESYTTDESGHYSSNLGNYHLSHAYGGVKLERMCSTGGGVTSVSTGGYGTKRELYNWMYAFLCGLDVNK